MGRAGRAVGAATTFCTSRTPSCVPGPRWATSRAAAAGSSPSYPVPAPRTAPSGTGSKPTPRTGPKQPDAVGSPARPPHRAAWVQSGVWVWSQSRKAPSSARERGRTVMNRPPRPAMWPIAAREHSLESAMYRKSSRPQQRDQPVPLGGDVGRVVTGVAVGEPVGQGHRAVGGDGQDPHQLFGVGAVVLGVPEGDRCGGLAATDGADGAPVSTVDRDGRGVVV